MRAHCHNQLLSYFSTDPKNPNALGVILSVDVYPIDYKDLRKTNAQVFAQIDADLTQALSLYPAGTPDRTTANADFARATRARSLALRGDYPNALIAANAAIAQSGLTLATTAANYRAVFHTDSQPVTQEVIFKIKKTATQTRTGAIWASVNATVTGSPFFEMSHSLLNTFNPTYTIPGGATFTTATPIAANPDARLSTILAPTSVFRNVAYTSDPNYGTNSEQIVIRKYPGVTTASNRVLINDIKISRLSEMYLIRAEAYAAANDLANAAAQVQIIRAARILPVPATPVYATQQDAWRGILTERRKEFAYEGYRYIDLKRLGALAGVTIDRDPKDCGPFNVCTPPAITDYRFTLPIPTVESNGNTAILAQQNPGY